MPEALSTPRPGPASVAVLLRLNNASMLLSLAASAAMVATVTAAAAAPRPHIIFVMIDDLVRARAATFSPAAGSRLPPRLRRPERAQLGRRLAPADSVCAAQGWSNVGWHDNGQSLIADGPGQPHMKKLVA